MTAPLMNGLFQTSGFGVSVFSDTVLNLAEGSCLDSTGTYTLTSDSTIEIDTSGTGVNGIDTGALGASSWYAVYVIGKSTDSEVIGGIISLNIEIPLLPTDYDLYRRVGWARTDGSSFFVVLTQVQITGIPNYSIYTWPSAPVVLTGGTATSATAVDLTDAVPIGSTGLQAATFAATYVPDSAGNYFVLNATNTSTLPSRVGLNPGVNNDFTINQNFSIVMGAPTIYYLVQASDSLDLAVSAFDDIY